MTVDYSLADIAAFLGAELRGDGDLRITGLSTLKNAGPGQLAFLANEKYHSQLGCSNAAAVIVAAKHLAIEPSPEAAHFNGTVLIVDNPYLGYARISQWFDPAPQAVPGVHPSAVIADSAMVADDAMVAANVVIEADVVIGAGCYLGAGTYIGARSQLGDNTRISANVSIYHDVVIGRNAVVHSGTVIGADGFGFAPDGAGQWQKIYQIGGVVIGDNVEIGAGSTIDRGALDDTRVGNGVIIDNQVLIAHNVVIGENTAIAGQSAIAGSASLGKNCTLAGGAGIVGHIDICDNVTILARGLASKSITEPGVYGSGMPLMKVRDWRKNAVRMTQVDSMARRIKDLERDK